MKLDSAAALGSALGVGAVTARALGEFEGCRVEDVQVEGLGFRDVGFRV